MVVVVLAETRVNPAGGGSPRTSSAAVKITADRRRAALCGTTNALVFRMSPIERYSHFIIKFRAVGTSPGDRKARPYGPLCAGRVSAELVQFLTCARAESAWRMLHGLTQVLRPEEPASDSNHDPWNGVPKHFGLNNRVVQFQRRATGLDEVDGDKAIAGPSTPGATSITCVNKAGSQIAPTVFGPCPACMPRCSHPRNEGPRACLF
jgi:hypothetical protein